MRARGKLQERQFGDWTIIEPQKAKTDANSPSHHTHDLRESSGGVKAIVSCQRPTPFLADPKASPHLAYDYEAECS